jgi:alpha-galactosidase
VYFGQLAWSGSWRLAFEQRPNGALHVHGGYNPFDFALELAPGERHTTPALLHGACADGFSGASQRMHAFLCRHVLPRTDPPETVRPVLYNSWEASYFALSLESQVALARKSAQIGVELFCVDDGWFGGRRNDTAGLGDWSVSREVFPTGLRPLADEVHRLGMKFGLWVEPEMVNPDSDLYRAHPDWVLHFPDRPRTEHRHQLILDFGRPEVLAHLARVLEQVVAENAVDFLKWDMNRSATEPGSVAGKAIWRSHAEGVYALMDGLRRRFPRLAIESCSSGGGRVDAGILARTDQFWTSDNTDALARVAIQEGASLAYPARAMCAWVTHERNHQTGRRLELSTRFDVAMRGALGIGSDLNALDDAELAEYAKWIGFYKRIRNVVQNGVCHRLQRLEQAGTSIVEYVLPDASEAVVSTVAVERRIAELVPPSRLRGLDPDALYAAFDRDEREYVRARGAELEALGLDPNLGTGRYGPGYSRTLWLRRIE